MMRIVSLSKHISMDKKGYYSTLEKAGRNGPDITIWLSWFLNTFAKSLHESKWTFDRIIKKVQFWQEHKKTALNDRQHKILNRLLDAGEKFEGGITTRKYAGMTKCSKVTASRDLSNLKEKKSSEKDREAAEAPAMRLISEAAP